MFISKRKLNNAEGIVQIKREISLAKACLTCKYHATFLENHELSRAAFKSSKYGKHTHNPQFLQSLWRRANARSVSFETIDGGQFTLSTQLIRLKDHIKAKLTILDVPLFDSAHSDNIPVGRVHLQQDNAFCWDVISHIVHLVKVWNKNFFKSKVHC